MKAKRGDKVLGQAIVKRLDDRCKEKGMSRDEVAERIDYSSANIARWGTLGSMPAVDIFFKVAKLLDMSAYELFTGEKEDNSLRSDEQELIDVYRQLESVYYRKIIYNSAVDTLNAYKSSFGKAEVDTDASKISNA